MNEYSVNAVKKTEVNAISQTKIESDIGPNGKGVCHLIKTSIIIYRD